MISGKDLVVNSVSGKVLVYDVNKLAKVATGEAARLVYTGHRSTFFTKAACCDGIVACGSQDKYVYVWSDPSTVVKLGSGDSRSSGHLHEVNEVVVTPDCLLSASDDASVIVWPLV